MNQQAIKLLVSVRHAEEAKAALEGGADIIDVKEPANGPLGMASAERIGEIVKLLGGRVPTSAALGELSDSVHKTTSLEVDYVKLGLAGMSKRGGLWQGLLRECFARYLPARPIAVGYADAGEVGAPEVMDALDWACENYAAGLLIDTACKDERNLFDWLSEVKLAGIIEAGHQHGLMIALAGSLSGESLRRAVDLKPDIVAVRGAACGQGDRKGSVDMNRVRELKRVIAGRTASDPVAAD